MRKVRARPCSFQCSQGGGLVWELKLEGIQKLEGTLGLSVCQLALCNESRALSILPVVRRAWLHSQDGPQLPRESLVCWVILLSPGGAEGVGGEKAAWSGPRLSLWRVIFPCEQGSDQDPVASLSQSVRLKVPSAGCSQVLCHLSLLLVTIANPPLRCELPGAWAPARVCKLVSLPFYLPVAVHLVPCARSLTSHISFVIMSFSLLKSLQ